MKIIWSSLFCCIFLFGGTQSDEFVGFEEIVAIANDSNATDGGVTNFAEFKDTEKGLIQLLSIEEYESAYYLGLLYLREYELQDITIKPNVKKAKEYFEIGSRHGVSQASIYLSMMYLSEKDYQNALRVLDKTINYKDTKEYKITPKNRLIMAMMFASTVLDNLSNDKIIVRKAITYLEPLATSQRSLRGAFYLAHLYVLVNDYDKANMYINIACLDEQTPLEIKKQCFNSPYIEAVELDKNSTTHTNK